MAARPWPEIPERHRWTLEMMEERLRETNQTPDELRARARELRAKAEQTDVKGIRDATLALADRYEKAAAAHISTR
ncbi:MAG TPA: hypothetical protein VFM94_04175 [Solirubrobacterales bacterium]|nr:hypothetical protein [Solirubrobacterales bacterium]